jgi:hypothetical protein
VEVHQHPLDIQTGTLPSWANSSKRARDGSSEYGRALLSTVSSASLTRLLVHSGFFVL